MELKEETENEILLGEGIAMIYPPPQSPLF